MTKYSLTAGVLIERVGDDLMVIVPGTSDFVRLSGPAAQLLLEVQSGGTVSDSDSALAHLLGLGAITASGVSRREVIKAGAIGAGVGIAVIASPSVAAASSGSCFSPASFNVGVGLNTDPIDPEDEDSELFYSYLTVNFDRPSIPVGLAEAIPDNHPGTFTPTSGPAISVLWQAGNTRFASFISLPFTEDQETALTFGTIRFTLDGCDYTGTGDILPK